MNHEVRVQRSPNEGDGQAAASYPLLITFSGIDGAGKTTQIERLSSYLQEHGFRVLRLSFWDHVAVWPKMRAGVGQRAADFCQTDQIAEDAFAPKNHKHIRKWYLTAARSGLYIMDVLRLRLLLASQRIRNSDVVIFDRYIYDQIANIYSRAFAARIYCQILLKHTPSPDLAFILDTSPNAAFARKPEYPLEFMHRNRQNFLRLREFVPQLITISDAGVDDVRREIQAHIRQLRLINVAAHEVKNAVGAENAVVLPQNSCRVRN
jgi:thymidylate kinase